MKFFDVEEDFIFEVADENSFWEAFEKFGPPGRDFRYCCKISKLSPIRRALSHFSNEKQILSFVGQRRYESFIRSQGEIWQNQYISNQLNASPVQNWNALMIWLYIFLYELPYNPLYDAGYDRIGCWLCPSSDMAHFEIIKKTHPELYAKLDNYIRDWIKSNNLPETFVDLGLWRFHHIPKKIQNLLPKGNIKTPNKTIVTNVTVSNTKSCRSVPPTITGRFELSFNLEKINEALALIGDNRYYPQHKFIHIETNGIASFLYNDGSFKIVLNNRSIQSNQLKEYLEIFFGTIFRAHECAKCELCAYECPTSAIIIHDGNLFVDQKKCIHCNQCFNVCPIINITRRRQINQVTNQVINQFNF